MDSNMLEKYAQLLVKVGVNLQKGQTLAISSPIECSYFARMIARTAYIEGAGNVAIRWTDELFAKDKYRYAPEDSLKEYPSWEKEFYMNNLHRGAAFLSIDATDPELFSDVDPGRLLISRKAASAALNEYRESSMNNRHVWCIASVPSVSWAKKVFPDLKEDDAVERLWEAIFKTVRIDTKDPVSSWREHIDTLKARVDYFNTVRFKSLHMKNSLGTDVEIELPEGHLWFGGSDHTSDGLEFVANMPTEEVYTCPKKTGVNGTVVSSMPLNLQGSLVENFSLTFKDGRIIGFEAEKGYETLKNVIETDEGSRYLGEVALVPYDSPISNLNILFYNTLFDENAACHIAIGAAYPICVRNGENMNAQELENAGVNKSSVHVDFMIGNSDLDITGITADGKETAIFRNGNFAI